MEDGILEDVVVFASDTSHYCRFNIVGWLGLGTKNLFTISSTVNNAMDLKALRAQAIQVIKPEGKKLEE